MNVGRKNHRSILDAYSLLKELSDTKLPAQTAYDLFKLVRSLQPVVDFRIREEQKLMSAYKINEDMKFETLDEATKILSEINSLDALEENIELDKPTVRLQDLGPLSINDVAILSEFITFETGGE